MTPTDRNGPGQRPAWRSETLDLATAQALEPEWADLARHAAEPNVFAFPWFVIPSLPLLAPLAPRLVTIREEELLIGLFLVRPDLGYAKLPIGFARTAMHHGQYLGTPLVRAGHEGAFAAGLCDWLDNAPARCAFSKLVLLPEEGPVARAIVGHCQARTRSLMAVNRIERAAIALDRPGGLDGTSHLGAGRRKSLRRAMQALSAHGPVVLERLEEPDQLDRWLGDFLTLENSGWKQAGGSSILSSAVETGFYRAMAGGALREGALNLFRLRLGERTIAGTLDLVAGQHVYCLKSAFDQALRKHAPGILIEYETLRYYRQLGGLTLVDSCTAPDNAMLNELWPDRTALVDLVVARRGLVHGALFSIARRAKRRGGLIVREV